MSNKTEEALRREVRDAFFNPTLGLHRSVDILDHPNVRKAFDAYDKAVIAANKPITHRWNIELDGDDLLICDGSHDKGEECKFVRYARVADRPTFEGDDAEVARLRGLLRWAHDTLYEINPANYDHDEVCKLNDASVEVIIGIAPEIGETHGKPSEWWADRASPSAKLERAEAALAEERKAMSEAASYAIEDLREWLVNYPDAYDRDTTEQAITTLSRFILPAKPAVDPLVAVLDAAGYAVFPEDLERVRATIERAGGVKAVFGEGL